MQRPGETKRLQSLRVPFEAIQKIERSPEQRDISCKRGWVRGREWQRERKSAYKNEWMNENERKKSRRECISEETTGESLTKSDDDIGGTRAVVKINHVFAYV